MERIEITPQIHIDPAELQIEFIRASGPGGQNVNKVSTAVRLRFDAAHSPSLPEPVRRRLVRLAGKKIDSQGGLALLARRFRTQEANRRDALERLVELIRRAAEEPKPRQRTKPTRASRERRLESKRQRSDVKKGRSGPPTGD